MLLKLVSGIFKMSRPTKRVKVIKNPNKFFVSSRENLEKLSQEELIQKIIRLEGHNSHLKNIIKKGTEGPPSKNKKIRKEINFETAPKRRVFLKFYYLGWDYHGLVFQEGTNNTIEDQIFNALKKCTLIESREKCNYQRCGRTDKGVSAFSQVISLDLRSKLSEPTLENVEDEYPYCSMLNQILPEDIKFYAWCPVSSDMSARFNCTTRMYKYYFPKGNFNIELMQQGAKFLLGSHDFRNFCKMDVSNGVTEFNRKIFFVDIRPCSFTGEESGSQMFEFVIKGNAFLLHQIRCIMSILFLIGEGKESPEIVKTLLDTKENPCRPQYNPAKPFPLNLYDVEYEGLGCNWIINEKVLLNVLQSLQNQCTEYSIKCSMMRDIMGSLEKQSTNPLELVNQVEILLFDLKRKTYQPLLERQTCGSLEEKIEHFTKKGKIETVNT